MPTLPSFTWDDSPPGRWLYDDGTPVKESDLDEIIRVFQRDSANHFANIARLAIEGKITPATFQHTMMLELKSIHLASASLGIGGWDRMSFSNFGRVGGVLRNEYRYLAQFASDIEQGSLTLEEATRRAMLYADNGFGQYWKTKDERFSLSGKEQEKLINEAGACPECQDIASEGWIPIGSISLPVHLGCRCRKIYR